VDELLIKFSFKGFAFVLGAVVGSFLNVCIYRLPLDSFFNQRAPVLLSACKNPIPWASKPAAPQLVVFARVAQTVAPKFAFRYFAVELLTALLFLAVWQSFPWQIAIAYGLRFAVIRRDLYRLEHFIIPARSRSAALLPG